MGRGRGDKMADDGHVPGCVFGGRGRGSDGEGAGTSVEPQGRGSGRVKVAIDEGSLGNGWNQDEVRIQTEEEQRMLTRWHYQVGEYRLDDEQCANGHGTQLTLAVDEDGSCEVGLQGGCQRAGAARLGERR